MTKPSSPDAPLLEQVVPLLASDAVGDPLTLAADLLRGEIDFSSNFMSENEGLLGCEEGPAGYIDEAYAAMVNRDYSNARAWLFCAIELGMKPVARPDKGRDPAGRQFRAQIQRDRLLLVARASLHLILPMLQAEILAERLDTLARTAPGKVH